MHGLVKLAAETEKKEHSPITQVGTGLAGATALKMSVDPLIGRKTLFHGTNKENANQIKQEGFRADKGGSGAAKVDSDFEENSKNYIHATGQKRTARFYAKVNDTSHPIRRTLDQYREFEDNLPGFIPIEEKDLLKSINEKQSQIEKQMRIEGVKSPFTPHNKERSEILKMTMPYGEYDKRFIHDKDGGLFRHEAAKTTENIPSSYIKGGEGHSRAGDAKRLFGSFPSYVKEHPGRFGAGVGLAGVGAGLVAKSVRPDQEN